jgi:uncharacterized protein YqgV (UPF0045/DUF77 family)
MKASVEISMYPLDQSYGTPILKFIQRLRAHEKLEVKTNTMSTQLFGEYDDLMAALTQEMKTTLEDEKHTTIMVLKIVNADLKP